MARRFRVVSLRGQNDTRRAAEVWLENKLLSYVELLPERWLNLCCEIETLLKTGPYRGDIMKPNFNEAKATQAAALLLSLRGGRMSYMKLIKLLYLVDRTALIRWGRPVTFDSYFSLPHGPVLSRTLDLITEGEAPDEPSIWSTCISEPQQYEIALRGECSTNELSQAEEDLIGEIFDRYGRMNRWQLVNRLHNELPEWQNPKGSSLPIEYRDILRAVGRTELEIAEIEAEIEGLALFEELAAV
jgi:uncharacterized phage-associated protein